MQSRFLVKRLKKVELKNPLVISGMPGIGNVAKITVDFLVDSLKAKQIIDITTYNLPNCVFVNEDNTVDLPKLEIYHKKIGGRDLLLLTGDIQPTEERGCYELCEDLVGLFSKLKVKEILTLGGIGLDEAVKIPKVYVTGTDKKTVDKYYTKGMKKGTDAAAGPIVGVSGVLLGMAKAHGLNGAVLLAETQISPTHLGIQGAKALIKRLDSQLKLKVDIKELNAEVKEIEKELKERFEKLSVLDEDKPKKISKAHKESISYIG